MGQPLKQAYPLQGIALEHEASIRRNLTVLKTKDQLNTIITDKSGQPDFLAINIFWDSLRSWYTPLEVHHGNGKITKHRKLRTKGIYYSAEKLATKHGVSKETIRKKLVKLEKLGLIHRSFEHKETVTTKSYNRRQIFVWKHTPHFFNPCGMEIADIGILRPQTNAKYVENKHNVIFGLQSQITQGLEARGGIHTLEDTKELREYSNKLEYRSNARAHESKFLNNSNSSNSLSEQVETTEADTPTCERVDNSVKVVNKKKFNSNTRKKPTVAERIVRYHKFTAYDQPKNLADHYPLSQEDCYELQRRSGKAYNLNGMNEILLAMSRKSKESKNLFVSKAKFMAYMTKAYREEGRHVDKVNSPSFKIMAGRTQAEVAEIKTLAQKETFFKQLEIRSSQNPGGIDQFKTKVGQLAPNQAYDFLSNLKTVEKVDNVLRVVLAKKLDFTQFFLDNVLNEANGVGDYMGVDKLEVMI